jgi:HK97 family phage prohead protease
MGHGMEFKSLTLELKADPQGIVSGYGSVFGGVDAYGDTVMPGAFVKSLTKRKPKMLWQHDMDDPIGVWDEVREDSKGLFVQGRLAMKTGGGMEACELLSMGAIDGLSIGFRTVADEIVQGGARLLKEVDLYEVSFVTIPADQAAMVQSVKSAMTERSFEAMLKQQGFSRWDAKIITADGWKAWAAKRDASGAGLDGADQRDAEAEVKKQLQQLLKGLSNV